MKNFLLFILLSASNLLYACGFYPYGEETRISLFEPRIFGYNAYQHFFYSADLYSSYGDSIPQEVFMPNSKLWFSFCREKVSIPAINQAIYQLTESDINEHSENEMIRYFYHENDSDALNYIRFAKNCEFFNSFQEDPWERKKQYARPKRNEMMHKAIRLSEKVQNIELKKRYTFLAIRLAWYNNQYDKIQSLFTKEFENTKTKDILYYWSLYFNSFTEKDSARANFELSQVFAYAPDKRFVCSQHYHSKVSLERTLQFAKSNEERANVYLLSGILKPDKGLPYLQKLYALNPISDGLSFLLLREINKIEDYVLTPYYTLFQPSISNDYWHQTSNTPARQILNRSERDRIYANEVLQFVRSADMKKVENPFFWRCSEAYLLFLTRDYKACLSMVRQLEKSTSNKEHRNQLEIIKALALTANQQNGNAKIPTEIHSTIISQKTNKQFIFAIGKEMEYLGNTTDAALLYAKLDGNLDEYSTIYWKTIKAKRQSYTDFFVNYFDYADAVYTPEQIQLLIDDIHLSKVNRDSFSVFKVEAMQEEMPRLYDLLGTKYIRQNKLDQALVAFEKVDNQHWLRNYTSWGEKFNIFDKNPFYCLKYTPQFIIPKDTIRLNKYTITKQLIGYLEKAEDKNEKDRDYYYFLAANAYYNMGRKGNVSMMRRINEWSEYYLSVIEDEAEFRQTNLAKKYYLLSKQHAKTDRFKALCLRMAIRCEKNKLEYSVLENEDFYGYNYDSLYSSNQYYSELQKTYPDYFDDLISSCDFFSEYFQARR